MMKVVLASASPRRRELFKQICPVFSVIPADVDESLPSHVHPREAVVLLAKRKARAVFNRVASDMDISDRENLVVLGADTVVALGKGILGKPKDRGEACRMLRSLSGREHSVYTGICFWTTWKTWAAADESMVMFNSLTDEQIREYVAGGSPMDKAGAYGIQDGVAVSGYAGSYSNIVGLPLELTEKMYGEVLLYDKDSH